MATVTHCKNFDSCCRTCLNDASHKMYDIFSEKEDSVNVAEMLALCTAIKAEKEDYLPKKLCGSCYNCLVSFYDFRKLAEKIDTKLRFQLENRKDRLDDQNTTPDKAMLVEIKIENDNSHLSVDYDILENDYVSETAVKHEKFDHDSNDEISYFCNLCGCYFDNYSELQEHRKLHSEADGSKFDLKCEFCKKKFKKLSKLEHHKVKYHTNDIYTCDFCSETFRHHFKFVKHLVTHGKGDDKNTDTSEINQNNTDQNKNLECDICSAHFKSLNSLSAHMRKHAKKGRVLACSLCGKVFKKVSHVKRHELCHEVNRPYKCTLCPKRFNTESLLKEHADKHKGIKPHSCPMCSKSFAHLSTLTSHIKIHTREKPFLCPTCGKKFDSSTNLKQHLRRHLGLKMFACSLCPRKFVSKGELKSHTITHTGEKSWTCDQCGATFTKRSSLEQHKLRHLGVKPHQCEACPMKFTTKDHLKRHFRIHTGEKPYRCDICERAFTQSNDLVKHRRAHLGDKLYKCSECNEGFRLHTELRQHISEHFISSQLKVLSVEKPNDVAKESIEHQMNCEPRGEVEGLQGEGLRSGGIVDDKVT